MMCEIKQEHVCNGLHAVACTPEQHMCYNTFWCNLISCAVLELVASRWLLVWG